MLHFKSDKHILHLNTNSKISLREHNTSKEILNKNLKCHFKVWLKKLCGKTGEHDEKCM